MGWDGMGEGSGGVTGCASDHSNTQLGLPPLVPELLPSTVIIIITLFLIITGGMVE